MASTPIFKRLFAAIVSGSLVFPASASVSFSQATGPAHDVKVAHPSYSQQALLAPLVLGVRTSYQALERFQSIRLLAHRPSVEKTPIVSQVLQGLTYFKEYSHLGMAYALGLQTGSRSFDLRKAHVQVWATSYRKAALFLFADRLSSSVVATLAIVLPGWAHEPMWMSVLRSVIVVLALWSATSGSKQDWQHIKALYRHRSHFRPQWVTGHSSLLPPVGWEAQRDAKIASMLEFTRQTIRETGDAAVRELAQMHEQVLLRLPELAERLTEAYVSLAAANGYQPGDIALYMVGGRLKNKAFRNDETKQSDIDFMFQVGNGRGAALDAAQDGDVAKMLRMMNAIRNAAGEISQEMGIPYLFDFQSLGNHTLGDVELMENLLLVLRPEASEASVASTPAPPPSGFQALTHPDIIAERPVEIQLDEAFWDEIRKTNPDVWKKVCRLLLTYRHSETHPWAEGVDYDAIVGRGVRLRLDHPIEWNGMHVEALILKGAAFEKGGTATFDQTAIFEAQIAGQMRQSGGHTEFDAEGEGRLEKAIEERLFVLDSKRAEAEYAVGRRLQDEQKDLAYHRPVMMVRFPDDPSSTGMAGAVVLAVPDFKEDRGRERIRQIANMEQEEGLTALREMYTGLGHALRLFHDAGFTHGNPHPDNFVFQPASIQAPRPVDFSDSRAGDEMSMRQTLGYRSRDLFYLLSSVYVMQVGNGLKVEMLLGILEGYFTEEERERYELVEDELNDLLQGFVQAINDSIGKGVDGEVVREVPKKPLSSSRTPIVLAIRDALGDRVARPQNSRLVRTLYGDLPFQFRTYTTPERIEGTAMDPFPSIGVIQEMAAEFPNGDFFYWPYVRFMASTIHSHQQEAFFSAMEAGVPMQHYRTLYQVLRKTQMIDSLTCIQAAMRYLAGPLYDHEPLINTINHVLHNPRANPRLGAAQTPISTLEGVSIEMWSVKMGAYTNVLQFRVILADGREVFFAMNVAKDLTHVPETMKNVYEQAEIAYRRSPKTSMEPFSRGVGLVETQWGLRTVPVMVSEWCPADELHVYKKTGTQIFRWADSNPDAPVSVDPPKQTKRSQQIWRHVAEAQVRNSQLSPDGVRYVSYQINAGDVLSDARNQDPIAIWNDGGQAYDPEFLILNTFLLHTEDELELILWDKPTEVMKVIHDGLLAQLQANPLTRLESLDEQERKVERAMRYLSQRALDRLPEVLRQPSAHIYTGVLAKRDVWDKRMTVALQKAEPALRRYLKSKETLEPLDASVLEPFVFPESVSDEGAEALDLFDRLEQALSQGFWAPEQVFHEIGEGLRGVASAATVTHLSQTMREGVDWILGVAEGLVVVTPIPFELAQTAAIFARGIFDDPNPTHQQAAWREKRNLKRAA